eukprot:Phypoly_transcript_13495.p1 GENE.Phypoly_transcript_13495~~Phypoly_transcript_13495.p1  ORF type:complete len:339 (+),score=55.22 Phypoly_transcript_13495:108-1019(+)
MKILLLLLLGVVASSAYVLKDSYFGQQIFDNFDFFNGPDPTHGYVYYATREESAQWHYTYIENSQAIIKCDDSTIAKGLGRGSVRLQSKNRYDRGLFIFDLQHMPTGMGTWPAVWTTRGYGWPAGGEIDIIEGVHMSKTNQMTLHTSPGCIVPTAKFAESGNPTTGDCGAAGGSPGCAIIDPDTWSYGLDFNAHGGGVYAMQWEADGVYVWLWARDFIPNDIKLNQPNPASWPNPRGRFAFNQGCNMGQYFNQHQMVIDLTFCGDWAGNTYPGGINACNSYVQNNPAAFHDAFWAFNYIQVYQ